MKSEGMSDASGVMTEEVPQAIGKRRQIRPRAERRQQLIDATIRCIAQHGLSKVTMQMVTSEAGLSVGIANLHFQSKDNLLKETLRFVAEEYHGGQIEIMEGSDMPDLGPEAGRVARLSARSRRDSASENVCLVCLLW
jgi:TetR/AcrR family transcriptional repressor of bet genes